MKITVEIGSKGSFEQDLAVFFLSEDDTAKQLERLGGLAAGIVPALHEQGLVKSKYKHIFITPTLGKTSTRMLGVAGLGLPADLTSEKIRVLAGMVASGAKAHLAKTVVIDLGALITKTISAEVAARALTEGLVGANYDYREFKSVKDDDQPTDLESAVLILDEGKDLAATKKGVEQGLWEAKAVNFTRNLVNQPPAQMHPRTLKEVAEELAKESSGLITAKIYGRDDLKKMGAGAILAVAQGSEFEPFLLHLHYKPAKAKKSVALVGKGVTFDSGGLSIKPSEAMEDMKMDMAGAATVLGIFSGLAEKKPDVEVHGVCACVENMVSDRSYRVGDIIKAMNGKTIEVLNTDAEGRLILADALHYAEKQQPDAIIDFATLTGAAIVALGDQISALMSNNEALTKSIMAAGQESGEKIWELPLLEEYDEYIKNDVADLQNINKGRSAGTIIGGLFLQHFVDNTPWAHLDIAGPAFNRKSLTSYNPAGATGWGVRTILHWLLAA